MKTLVCGSQPNCPNCDQPCPCLKLVDEIMEEILFEERAEKVAAKLSVLASYGEMRAKICEMKLDRGLGATDIEDLVQKVGSLLARRWIRE